MSDRSAVIIGGGITGVLAARALALQGWSVTLLEGAHVGAGSSSRTAAGIRQQFSTRGNVIAMQYCVDWYTQFQYETEAQQSPLVQNGYLFLVDTAEDLESARGRVAMQHEVGLTEVELLEGQALIDRYPWLDGDTTVGGTFCPTDGFLLPHLIYNEGAKRVRQLGGVIVQQAPVVSAERQGDRIVSVTTRKGVFEADLFLDCTNAWTRRVGALLGAEELPVDPLKRYLWFLARGGEMTAEQLLSMPLTITPGGIYVRPENGDTLMMGKKHDTPPDLEFGYDDQDEIEPEFSHKTGIDAKPFELWAELAEVMPAAGEFDGINATTCGYYATTPDHNPFLGYDRQTSNLIRLVGHSGHGAMFGPFTAAVAATLAESGGDVDHVTLDGRDVSLSPFAIGREFTDRELLVI